MNPANQKEDDFANTENKPRTDFDLSLLKNVIKKFAGEIQASGRNSLASTLVNSNYHIGENYLIKMELSSSVEQNSLEQNKLEIIGYFRRNLKNWGIDITYEVIKKENSNDVQLMTSIDKFKKMSEKNPTLLQLQKIFKLDIDF